MYRSPVRFAQAISSRKLLEKIIRVDHIGELAAINIYDGQKAVIRDEQSRLLIEKMRDEESNHLEQMERLRARHNAPTTIFTPVFASVAYILGVGTALLGKETAMACTTAVEELIGQHYNDQMIELLQDDPVEHSEIIELLKKLRDDELHHHDIALANDAQKAPQYDLLKFVIQTGCKGAIFMAERI